jgi:uncharacterized protein YggU (UPF0235/DUF167 family)
MGKPDSELDVDDLELAEVEGGVRLRLRVKAGGRSNALLGIHAGALKLTVTTAPEKGKANKAVLALLADRLDVPTSSLELVTGATSPDKTVLVPLNAATVRRRLSG